MTLNEYLENNLSSFDKNYLSKKYQKKLSTEDCLSIENDKYEDPILKLNIDTSTLKITEDNKLSVFKSEYQAGEVDYFKSDEAQGVLLYYYIYDSDKDTFTTATTDIIIEDSTKITYYKYGYTYDGNARIIVKIGDNICLYNTESSANVVSEDKSSLLSYKDNTLTFDGEVIKPSKVLTSSDFTNTEVYPLEETDWN